MKREADAYITKDHGSTPRTSEESRKMATPAQLAARKIKAPKSRVGRSTTPTLGSSSFGAGFGSSNATQSFPPPTTQQSFAFSVPNTSSSFTFGQQNNESQPVSNPFAMNGSVGGQDNSMMQDPTSQQSSTNGLFGGFGSTTQSVPAPPVNGFSFGQSSTANFGGSSVFGQPKSQEESKPAFSAGVFGSQPQSNGFTPAFGQPSASSFPPASSPSPGSTPFDTISSAPAASVPTFKFGGSNVIENKSTTPEPVGSTTPKAKPLFNFAQTTNFSQSSSDPASAPASAPAKPLFSFAPQSSSTPPPQSTIASPTSLFGATAASANPPEPATAPAKPLFNFEPPAGKSTEKSSVTNSFGNLPKPAESSSASTSLFNRASPTTETQPPSAAENTAREGSNDSDAPSNPFSGFFGNKPNLTQSSSPSSGFQFNSDNGAFASPGKQVSQPTGASAKSPAAVDRSDKPASLFSFPPVAPTTSDSFPTPPASVSSTSNLFNLNKPAPSAPSEKAPTQSQPNSSLFSKTSEMNANAGSTPFKPFHQAATEDAGPAKKRLFQSPTAAESMSQLASPHTESTSIPSEPVQPKFTQPQRPQPAVESVTRAVSTEGPPQIPRYLSADKYKSYDENWRLKALNRRFKQVVTSIDPDTHDFLSTIQNYLDHRESIAEGLSRWMRRQTAGSKRKPDDVDDMQPDSESSKRSKPSDNIPAPKPHVTAANLFGSVPSPKPASNASPARAAESATSTMFKSLIPGATSAPPVAAPTFSFTTASARSTTPPSSPPKPAAPQLPQFAPPKFGGGNVDFASAFAKNAATTAEKAEQEAKAKRKAEDFDSDEDDEEAWEKKYEEEQREKKAKLNSVSKAGFLPAFVPSVSSSRSNSPFAFTAATQTAPAPRFGSAQPISDSEKAVISIESDGEGRTGSTSGESGNHGNESGNSGDDEDEEEDDLPEDQVVDLEEDDEGEPIPDLPKGESLFDRISKPPSATTKADEPIFGSAVKPYYKPAIMFDNIGKESPEQPKFSPFTPKGDFVPASSFTFKPATSSGPAFGASLKEGPVPGEGLFGSRPSTPQPGTVRESSNMFGSSQKPTATANNTWTKGSPIKFSESTASDKDAPLIEVSAATPPAASKNTFGSGSGFFGAASSSGGSVGFNFGGAPTQPAPGYLAAASHLSSGGASGFSSRGSSPGLLSEAESVNTDTSTAQDEVHSNQPQISLMATNAGEENEEVLFDARAHLSRNFRKVDLPQNTKLVEGWNKMGTGVVKLLKDKTDGKCRILFRAEPNANILLNTRLVSGGAYNSVSTGKTGSLTFPVAIDGNLQTWKLTVKTKDQTDALAKLINSNNV